MIEKRYDFMNRNEKFGEWIEKIDRGHVELGIQLGWSFPFNELWVHGLVALSDENNYINHDGVMFWIDNRIIPITRDNLKAYLKGMELDEYEPISIMHRTLAMNVTDCYWVKFNPNASFDKNHPRGSHYECPFYNHNNLYSKVNLNGEFI